jgi:hypothetical protein
MSAQSSARRVFLSAVSKHYPAVVADLRAAESVDAWMKQYPQMPSWVRPYASTMRQVWTDQPSVPSVWGVFVEEPIQSLAMDGAPPVGIPAYDPRIETRASFLQRAETLVAGHVKEREAAAMTPGYSRRPRKDPRHFNWLVRHLFGGDSYADIWRSDRSIKTAKSPSVVREGCLSLAAFLDITIPGKRSQK